MHSSPESIKPCFSLRSGTHCWSRKCCWSEVLSSAEIRGGNECAALNKDANSQVVMRTLCQVQTWELNQFPPTPSRDVLCQGSWFLKATTNIQQQSLSTLLVTVPTQQKTIMTKYGKVFIYVVHRLVPSACPLFPCHLSFLFSKLRNDLIPVTKEWSVKYPIHHPFLKFIYIKFLSKPKISLLHLLFLVVEWKTLSLAKEFFW